MDICKAYRTTDVEAVVKHRKSVIKNNEVLCCC